jgi:hypothetical protein
VSTSSKILTSFHLDQSMMRLATKVAEKKQRSFANYIEWLIKQDLKARGVK